MLPATRREFLGNIGNGMLWVSLGPQLAGSLGIVSPPADLSRSRRGQDPVQDAIEALVRQMQELAPDELLPLLIDELQAGTKLGTLVTAGALANARTFGGVDYDGYHAFMALLPAYAMAQQMPERLAALPVLKVLYRNTARIRVAGHGRQVLEAVEATATDGSGADALQQRVRARDMAGAEQVFAQDCGHDLAVAYEDVQRVVRDDIDVHRIVLSWRAWDMLRLAGAKHAHTLLRQSVRYCVDQEKTRVERSYPVPPIRADLPRILDQSKLLAKTPGERVPDDAWIDALSRTVFGANRAHAAEAVAAALAEGFAPDAVGEAISLAANQLLLHDTGARRVHGASVGVHASDAANAWRNVARAVAPATAMTSLVVAAYHTAGQMEQVGREPYAFAEQLQGLATEDPGELLQAAGAAIEQRDQRAAMAALQRYGDLGHRSEPAFALLLRYAVSQDGALHAEKYFHTVREEFERTRPAFRWRRMIALARVTASEFGEPAPGVARAQQLLEG